MKTEDHELDIAGPLFGSHEKLRDLERHLYGHVLEVIDWDALQAIDEYLYALVRKCNVSEELALDLSNQLIERALHRAAYDPIRFGMTSIPFGITEEERRAVAFDDTCPFCKFEKKLAEQAAKDAANPRPPPPPDECCPLCDDMAAEWREEHAEALARAGLSPPAHDHAHGHGEQSGRGLAS